jgi:hypothetical protein
MILGDVEETIYVFEEDDKEAKVRVAATWIQLLETVLTKEYQKAE